MSWKTGTIRLDAARQIFTGVDFEEVKVDGKTVGYRAFVIEIQTNLESTSLTNLCSQLWQRKTAFK